MARHDHDDVSQTQAEQRRSARSVTARESIAAGQRTPSCSSTTAALSKPTQGDVFADTAADLAESANVEEAHCCDLGNMLLHRQFRIEQNAKVTHDV